MIWNHYTSTGEQSGFPPAASTEKQYFAGLDLGQRRDYTAIAVVERDGWPGEGECRLRHLERLPLGASYLLAVDRVRLIVRSPAMKGRCTVIADATGVGAPVIDLLRNSKLGCALVPVIITGGLQETTDANCRRTPKGSLIARLQMMLQQRRLRIATRLPEAAALLRELHGMQMRVTATGRERYGAWREGAHDDMVLALALACWGASIKKKIPRPANEWLM